jgi:hypothetical protein
MEMTERITAIVARRVTLVEAIVVDSVEGFERI